MYLSKKEGFIITYKQVVGVSLVEVKKVDKKASGYSFLGLMEASFDDRKLAFVKLGEDQPESACESNPSGFDAGSHRFSS